MIAIENILQGGVGNLTRSHVRDVIAGLGGSVCKDAYTYVSTRGNWRARLPKSDDETARVTQTWGQGRYQLSLSSLSEGRDSSSMIVAMSTMAALVSHSSGRLFLPHDDDEATDGTVTGLGGKVRDAT